MDLASADNSAYDLFRSYYRQIPGKTLGIPHINRFRNNPSNLKRIDELSNEYHPRFCESHLILSGLNPLDWTRCVRVSDTIFIPENGLLPDFQKRKGKALTLFSTIAL